MVQVGTMVSARLEAMEERLLPEKIRRPNAGSWEKDEQFGSAWRDQTANKGDKTSAGGKGKKCLQHP